MPELASTPVICFWAALALSLLGTPLARLLAVKFDIQDHPRAGVHKTHREPTPYLGGVPMFVATLLTLLWAGFKLPLASGAVLGLPNEEFGAELSIPLIALALVWIFLVGVFDDVRAVPQRAKMGHIAGAASVMYLGGIGVDFTPWHALNYPLTLLWMLGITNAANLMDNMNGLSSGTGAIVAFGYALLAGLRGDNATMALALALCGGLLGFWVYNFPKAKIFLGDAGAMTLGFSLAMIGLLCGRNSATLGDPPALGQVLAAIMMASIFMADTFFVAFSRHARLLTFWDAGKDHTSHRFVNLGLSPVQAVLACYSLAAILTMAAAALYFIRDPLLGIGGAALIVLASIAFWMRLHHVPVEEVARAKAGAQELTQLSAPAGSQ